MVFFWYRSSKGLTSISTGALRAIAIASNGRASSLPDVPAAAETLPGFDFQGWFMLMAPAGTPPAVIAKVNAAADAATKDPQVKELSAKLGFDLQPNGVGSPQTAADFLKAQLAVWEKISQELAIEKQ